jgi:hypothetical protein
MGKVKGVTYEKFYPGYKPCEGITIVSYSHMVKIPRSGTRHFWNCKCNLCGKSFVARQDNLRSSNTDSCGCIRQKYYESMKGRPINITGRNGREVPIRCAFTLEEYVSIAEYCRNNNITRDAAYYREKIGHIVRINSL